MLRAVGGVGEHDVVAAGSAGCWGILGAYGRAREFSAKRKRRWISKSTREVDGEGFLISGSKIDRNGRSGLRPCAAHPSFLIPQQHRGGCIAVPTLLRGNPRKSCAASFNKLNAQRSDDTPPLFWETDDWVDPTDRYFGWKLMRACLVYLRAVFAPLGGYIRGMQCVFPATIVSMCVP